MDTDKIIPKSEATNGICAKRSGEGDKGREENDHDNQCSREPMQKRDRRSLEKNATERNKKELKSSFMNQSPK